MICLYLFLTSWHIAMIYELQLLLNQFLQCKESALSFDVYHTQSWNEMC